jgi:hypothetical protein
MSMINSEPEVPNYLWFKSTRSASNGNCVEVAFAVQMVAIRDSKDPTGPVLRFTRSAWQDFLTSIRAGAFESL